MKIFERILTQAFVAAGVIASAACVFSGCTSTSKAAAVSKNAVTSLPKLNMAAWNYNEEDNVYWQTGISYAATPADAAYETLGIYVPGEYFNGTKNADGTYTVSINRKASVAGFTADTAPFVMPVQTPGYAALEPPTGYVSNAAEYIQNGFIFVYAGARGRDHGAPAGVTDFKAAIRYVRYNAELLPGDTARFFTYGMSGGGAQSAIIGASGDSAEYEPYLEAIGAVRGVSDAVMGSMDWCPITNLNVADAAYEWELGVARTGLDADTKALSDGLAVAFAEYINSLGLKDENGNLLTLEQSADGLYHAGSYYEYLKKTIETSLNKFLADTTFPYNVEAQKAALGTNMILPEGWVPRGPQGMAGNAPRAEDMDGVQRGSASGKTVQQIKPAGTYNTVQDYIAALNANEAWVTYDAATNTATIASVESFMRNVKQLQKSVGAFDDLSGTQPENTLFGYNDGSVAHFDAIMASLLEGTEKGAEYAAALARKDSLGFTVDYRVNLYNPMYFLSPAYSGYKTSTPAKFWRIHAGIFQGDTAVSTELAYYLALVQYGDGVKSVEFEDVWGLYHTEAERVGNAGGDGTSTGNLIQWIKDCLSADNA